VHSGKEVHFRNFKAVLLQPMLSSDNVIVEHLVLDVLGTRGAGQKIMGKQERGNERMKGVKEEGKNGSSLPDDLMQNQ
jgi:hypothetical protein